MRLIPRISGIAVSMIIACTPRRPNVVQVAEDALLSASCRARLSFCLRSRNAQLSSRSGQKPVAQRVAGAFDHTVRIQPASCRCPVGNCDVRAQSIVARAFAQSASMRCRLAVTRDLRFEVPGASRACSSSRAVVTPESSVARPKKAAARFVVADFAQPLLDRREVCSLRRTGCRRAAWAFSQLVL